jgi:hypothetical protein
MGIGIWTTCFLASHQVKHMIETINPEIIYRTIIVFFLLNTIVSATQYLCIVFETGAINPFRYQGEFQKYFISTGDYIKGISFDTSTTNAVLNAFGAIFFLYKRNWLMLLVCTCTLLFTASNLANLLLYFNFLLLFLFRSTREQKSFIVICGALLVVFITKISPQNNQYAVNLFEQTFQLDLKRQQKQDKQADVREIPNYRLTPEQKKEKIALIYLDSVRMSIAQRSGRQHSPGFTSNNLLTEKLLIPEPSIHSAPFQNRDDTNTYRKELLAFTADKAEYKTLDKGYEQSTYPGKVIAAMQTGNYLLQHPFYLLTGAGLGNFSSKVAFKATALHFAGGFPQRLAYIHPDFSSNHLSLYTYFFSKRANAHSIINTPNSVYDQLLSEYGFIGLAGFFILYISFFAKHYRKLTYGLPLLFLLSGFFLIDYWFEQLSIVVLFELLLFLNLKETAQA